METTNIVNLGQRSEEQLDWVGDLTPPHLCITPDTPEYAQRLSDLQQKQGEA